MTFITTILVIFMMTFTIVRNLNLTVKKDRGGTIMAQSMMAKGPDGTIGFKPGWTTRVSRYARRNDDIEDPKDEAKNDENKDGVGGEEQSKPI